MGAVFAIQYRWLQVTYYTGTLIYSILGLYPDIPIIISDQCPITTTSDRMPVINVTSNEKHASHHCGIMLRYLVCCYTFIHIQKIFLGMGLWNPIIRIYYSSSIYTRLGSKKSLFNCFICYYPCVLCISINNNNKYRS